VFGCAGVLIALVLAIVAAVSLFKHIVTDTPGAVVEVNAPSEVYLGDTFILEVVVKNDRKNEPLKVEDIDIHDKYLAGFFVVSTEPKHKNSTHVPTDPSQSYTFDRTIQAGQTNRFVFNLRAIKSGVFRGDVDVTEGFQFVTEEAQTVVKEKE
jgi:hypothetical protein